MSRIWLPLLLLLPICCFAGGVYKWVDDNGRTHYSDSKGPDAEKVKLKPTSTFKAVFTEADHDQSSDSFAKDDKETKSQALEIVRPLNDALIRNNYGRIDISVATDADLQDGDNFVALIDGTRIGGTHSKKIFFVEGVYRGEHELRVQLLSPSGRVISESPAVNINMKRYRVGMVKKKKK